ncbi:Arc family DNA-binding protein [Ensifer adhaerens]|uniref:Arc family DNA-binding protein n=1 Tax=Ensifer adhaerens TaxID=106592 RepID=UPI0015688674|nr:Arc family DNA-binding protein [Ensifer adhaerens]
MTRQDPHFRLRVPEVLKQQIEAAARTNARSITAEIVERLERSFALASENDGGLASEIEDIRDRLGRVRDAVVARETDKDHSQNS